MKNILIAFEGLDGSGKTTQIKKLYDWFIENNLKVHVTKQPTDYYRKDERVRNYLDNGIVTNMYSLALLAAADRTYQISSEINPKLNEGSSIICDRYLYSSLAFFKARGIDYCYVKLINKDVPEPDIVIFLDISSKRALERVRLRDGENIKFEEKDDQIFYEIRKNFLDVLPTNTLIIDSMQSTEVVHEQIIQHIKNFLRRYSCVF